MTSNSLIVFFNKAYEDMVDTVNSSEDYLKCIRAINNALDALLSAKAYIPDIESSSMTNLLIIARSFKRKYQNKDKEEVHDLLEYLNLLADLVPSRSRNS